MNHYTNRYLMHLAIIAEDSLCRYSCLFQLTMSLSLHPDVADAIKTFIESNMKELVMMIY